jgi:hypothetical protein
MKKIGWRRSIIWLAAMLLLGPAAMAQTSPVQLVGSYSYSVNTGAGTVTLDVNEIENTSSTSGTGTLRLELWLTTAPYEGGTINGVRVALYQLQGSSNGTLGPNENFPNVSATVPLTNLPAAGSYYATLLVTEYTESCGTSDGYCIDTYGNFSNQFVVTDAVNPVDVDGNVSSDGGGGGAIHWWDILLLSSLLLFRLSRPRAARARRRTATPGGMNVAI